MKILVIIRSDFIESDVGVDEGESSFSSIFLNKNFVNSSRSEVSVLSFQERISIDDEN